MREKVLLVGEMNTSKTWSIVNLAILYPDKKVVVFDPDDGIEKLVVEIIGPTGLPNLEVIPLTSDWERTVAEFKRVDATLRQGDWLCFDMINRLWDFSQEYYSQVVFGESPIQHLLTLKREAQKSAFGGFDGLTDWAIIKRMHNAEIVDKAVIHPSYPYNVMATTGLRVILPVEKTPAEGTIESVFGKVFGFKPEGEKHNVHRFDGLFYLYRKKDNSYWFRIIRDRGRFVDMHQEYKITTSFWGTYKEMRGIG